MPHIEFLKGIPTALKQDSYFDVNKQNLIVFDDQMIDASKDKRIVNLFTRGSHHRNLSEIYAIVNNTKRSSLGEGKLPLKLDVIEIEPRLLFRTWSFQQPWR